MGDRARDVFYALNYAGEIIVVWQDPEQPAHTKIAPTRVTLDEPHEVFVEAVREAERRLLSPYTEDISIAEWSRRAESNG